MWAMVKYFPAILAKCKHSTVDNISMKYYIDTIDENMPNISQYIISIDQHKQYRTITVFLLRKR